MRTSPFMLETEVDTDNQEEMRAAVETEIELVNAYFAESRSMTPLMSIESAAIKEYLHAKARGLIPNGKKQEDETESENP